MRSWRLIVLLLLFGGGAIALRYLSTRHDGNLDGQAAPATQAAYDYEAHDVVLRQMGPDGRLAYQIEAQQITQLPDSGKVIAQALTLYHDPPGTPVGSPNRWKLTADQGELPAEGGVVTLTGKAHARGIPVGTSTAVNVATERLRYDIAAQELGSDTEVQLDWGKARMRCRTMQANIATGDAMLESCVVDWGAARMQCRKVQANIRTGDWARDLCDDTVDP